MRPILKLSALTLSVLAVLAVAACNSSDSDDETEFTLQRDLEYVQGLQLLQSGGDLWLTDMNGGGSRLAEGDEEWEFLVNGITGNATFLFEPAPQQFAMTTQQIRMFSISNDNGNSWELHQAMSELPVPYTSYSAMKLIGDDVYLHAGEGLHRTQLDINRPEESFSEFAVLHDSGLLSSHLFEHRVRALIHNEPRNELWWTEFGAVGDEEYRVMRMDLISEEVELAFSHDTNPMQDGFVDNTDPNTLVFAGEEGVRISHDNGETWTLHYMDEDAEAVAYAVKQDSVSQRYYAYVNMQLDDVSTDEMWCSADQGSSWTRTTLAEGGDGIGSSRGPMVFHDRAGTRYFFIPTFDGVVRGAVDDLAC